MIDIYAIDVVTSTMKMHFSEKNFSLKNSLTIKGIMRKMHHRRIVPRLKSAGLFDSGVQMSGIIIEGCDDTIIEGASFMRNANSGPDIIIRDSKNVTIDSASTAGRSVTIDAKNVENLVVNGKKIECPR